MGPFISECALPKFFRRSQQHILMFGFVQGVIKALPSVPVTSAIRNFLDHFNIDGDIPSLETEYRRILKELMEADKG